ncbi:MAG: EAL domain-containing protein [Lachnospiraceae bacterium]|nr:EAL domain-containing protein [Lachnospiraceae bacterium]
MPEQSRERQKFIRFVLVADDEEVNRELLRVILEDKYELLFAADGEEALSMIRSFKDILSLVILDIMMPKKNGVEVLQEMQEDAELKRIPAIMLTSDKGAEVECLKIGAADFLTKPYDLPEVIHARVDHSIRLFENTNLIRATERDPLTGLYNREFFFEYCSQYRHRNPNQQMDALVLNINQFHVIDELYGRAFGDSVLCAVSNRLRHIVMVAGGLASRYDADSFYVFLPHREEYDSILDLILIGLGEILTDSEMRLRMGVYPDLDRNASLEEGFGRALQACNKRNGSPLGRGCAIYDRKMHEKRVYQARLMEDIDKAIAEGQFRIYYQPKFNIKGEKPVLASAEALVRWEHPEFGMVSPGDFIPVFEENGFIQRLDRHVWRETARQIHAWKELYGAAVPISVNVSRMDIYAPDFEDYLESLLREFDLTTEDMLLEITESAYTESSEHILRIAQALRQEGFRLEMDDFGSGYSSLNMLTVMPVDALKMDKGFLNSITTDEKAVRMVQLIIEIAQFLEIPTIAEGVESEEEYRLLKDAGCDIIQGYYFSRPLPAEEFERYVRKWLAASSEQGVSPCGP